MRPFFGLEDFVRESNKIENIHRDPYPKEIEVTKEFLTHESISITALQVLVTTYAPGHRLRDKPGMDVRIGSYYPPKGGPAVREELEALLERINSGEEEDSYRAHVNYESLHPFTDGNGRSGRALWLWLMSRPHGVYNAPLGFLHTFYYQTLQNSER